MGIVEVNKSCQLHVKAVSDSLTGVSTTIGGVSAKVAEAELDLDDLKEGRRKDQVQIYYASSFIDACPPHMRILSTAARGVCGRSAWPVNHVDGGKHTHRVHRHAHHGPGALRGWRGLRRGSFLPAAGGG